MSKHRHKKPEDAAIILPITPMLDMSFQLLFFFICIYRPPTSTEAEFAMDLTPRQEKKDEPKPPPSDVGGSGQGTGEKPEKKEEDIKIDEKDLIVHKLVLTLDTQPKMTDIEIDGKKTGKQEMVHLAKQIRIKGAPTTVRDELPADLFPKRDGDSLNLYQKKEDESDEANRDREKELLQRLKVFVDVYVKYAPDEAKNDVRVRVVAPEFMPMGRVIEIMDAFHSKDLKNVFLDKPQ